MKKILLIITALMLIVGCGKKDGVHTEWYKNGQKKSEVTYKNGKLDGLVTNWYENGQKETEGTYKDGKLISRKDWKYDGSVME